MKPSTRAGFGLLACALLLGQALAQDGPPAELKQVLDPAVAAASGAAGAAAGLALDAATLGKLDKDITKGIVSNGVVAADSAGKAVGAAGAAIGSLLAGKAGVLGSLSSAHANAGQAFVEFIRAINSLHIAGTNLAVGATDKVFGGLLDGIKKEAGTIGDIYLALVGEFGRSVGAGLGAIETLTRGSLASLNPLVLGADALQAHIDTLITFLQGAVDASVASPDKALKLGPFLGLLKSVKALLGGLQGMLLGPQGDLANALSGAVDAAAGALGAPAVGAPGVAGIANGVQTAIGLVNNLLAPLGH